MDEDSIVAKRVVYDELCTKGFDISSVEISQTMMRKVRSAGTSYSQYPDMKKQTASKEQKRKAEKRKTEAQIKSLERQKKQKMQELCSQTQQLNDQIRELKRKL